MSHYLCEWRLWQFNLFHHLFLLRSFECLSSQHISSMCRQNETWFFTSVFPVTGLSWLQFPTLFGCCSNWDLYQTLICYNACALSYNLSICNKDFCLLWSLFKLQQVTYFPRISRINQATLVLCQHSWVSWWSPSTFPVHQSRWENSATVLSTRD